MNRWLSYLVLLLATFAFGYEPKPGAAQPYSILSVFNRSHADSESNAIPYRYNPFGNLISRTGNTPNNYLYCGEQLDPDLSLYFLRARYLNPDTGRFWTMDDFEGSRYDPLSLHKYLYASASPVDRIDPSGNRTLAETQVSVGLIGLVAYALYSATPSGQKFNRQMSAALSIVIISVVNAISAEIASIDDLVVFSRNKQARKVVDGLIADALRHSAKLQSYGSGGGGPQDPRNHWKKEIKASLQRAKNVVQSRLKNLKDVSEEYLKKIQEIADKNGVTLD